MASSAVSPWQRARAWWRTTHRAHDDPAGPGAGHDHELPRSLLLIVAVIALGLLAGIVISYAALSSRLAASDRFDEQMREYVAGRGVQRDAENRQLNDRLDDLVCDVLDELPPSPELDRLRTRYGCGPGLDPGVTP